MRDTSGGGAVGHAAKAPERSKYSYEDVDRSLVDLRTNVSEPTPGFIT
jgi:hypothetical protein